MTLNPHPSCHLNLQALPSPLPHLVPHTLRLVVAVSVDEVGRVDDNTQARGIEQNERLGVVGAKGMGQGWSVQHNLLTQPCACMGCWCL